MTRSQWRREQRRRKAQREIGAIENAESNTNVPARKKEKEDLKLVEMMLTIQAKTDKEKHN